MKLLTILFLCFCMALEFKFTSPRAENSVLLRRKRYLVFPEGSTIQLAICLTAQTYIPTEIYTTSINWGVAYDLPNKSSTIREFLHPKHIMKRRNRRDLYQKMEVIMDSMGYNGRSCILRTLCEASRHFASNGNDVLQEIIRIVFDFPQQKVMNWEPEEHRLYHWAYRVGRERELQECFDIFPQCSFSLLDVALGKYFDYLQGYT